MADENKAPPPELSDLDSAFARARDPKDRWFYARTTTPNELNALRQFGLRHALKVLQREEPLVFTCDDCVDAVRCTLAFDPYNTDGDCLYVK